MENLLKEKLQNLLNKLCFQSNDVVWKIYSTPWFLMKRKFCKCLIFIMVRAQRAPCITGGKYFPVNFKTYVKVI